VDDAKQLEIQLYSKIVKDVFQKMKSQRVGKSFFASVLF